jgi:hypothetical protein
MTEPEAAKLVTMLVTAYPSMMAKLTEEQQADTRRIYRAMLVDLDYELAGKALRGLITTCKFMPTIAEIREAAMHVKFGRQRPGGDAWGDVVAAMKRYGSYRTPGVDFQFEDPLVARAVAAFGWKELCGSENAIADRARFIELYEHMLGNARTDSQIAPGLPEPTVPEQRRITGARSIGELVAGPQDAPFGIDGDL